MACAAPNSTCAPVSPFEFLTSHSKPTPNIPSSPPNNTTSSPDTQSLNSPVCLTAHDLLSIIHRRHTYRAILKVHSSTQVDVSSEASSKRCHPRDLTVNSSKDDRCFSFIFNTPSTLTIPNILQSRGCLKAWQSGANSTKMHYRFSQTNPRDSNAHIKSTFCHVIQYHRNYKRWLYIRIREWN